MIITPYEIQPLHTKYADEETRWEAREEERTVEVHRTEAADDITGDIAAGALDLLAAAYAHQFELRQAHMPEGTFRRHFDSTDEAKVAKQAKRMKNYIESGSAYSFVFDDDIEGLQLALAKVSPSCGDMLQKAGLKSPNAYLDDIAVDPGHQGQKLASLVMFDLLGEERFDQRRSLTADGFAGAKVANYWFQRMGMGHVAVQLEPMVLYEETGSELQPIRFSTEGVVSLCDINDRLAHRLGISVEPES